MDEHCVAEWGLLPSGLPFECTVLTQTVSNQSSWCRWQLSLIELLWAWDYCQHQFGKLLPLLQRWDSR